MTNAQKWVTAFLLFFMLLFFIGRLTEKEEVIYEDYGSYETQPVSNEMDPQTLLARNKCNSCHGADLQGTALGPSLYSAKEYWSRENLINYLRNPSSYEGDDRFEEYKRKYKSIMPPYGNVDVKQLGVIADHILNLK